MSIRFKIMIGLAVLFVTIIILFVLGVSLYTLPNTTQGMIP